MDLLVIEAQSGNSKAFECLVEYFQPILNKFARSLSSNSGIADDAVQEAWITISRKVRALNDPRAFKGWLFRTVRWRLLDLAKSYPKNHASYELVEESHSETLSQPLNEDELVNRELKQAIAQLAPTERSVIHLFYLAELSVVEIGYVLDIPEGTVKSRLSRARKLLKQLIASE